MSSFTGFRDYPDTSTPLTAEYLNAFLDSLFPIGKVVMFDDDLDHSNYMGFTWVRTAIGRMPIGLNSNDSDFDETGKTGGEKKHTLTIDEMPSHRHDMRRKIGGEGFNTPYGNDSVWKMSTASTGIDYGSVLELAGGGQPHNNMPPYQVFAFWKRIEAS